MNLQQAIEKIEVLTKNHDVRICLGEDFGDVYVSHTGSLICFRREAGCPVNQGILEDYNITWEDLIFKIEEQLLVEL
jgi:hypothetical protein